VVLLCSNWSNPTPTYAWLPTFLTFCDTWWLLWVVTLVTLVTLWLLWLLWHCEHLWQLLHLVTIVTLHLVTIVTHGDIWWLLVTLGDTWRHSVTLGDTWWHLVTLGDTWWHLVTLGDTWWHLVSLVTFVTLMTLSTFVTIGTLVTFWVISEESRQILHRNHHLLIIFWVNVHWHSLRQIVRKSWGKFLKLFCTFLSYYVNPAGQFLPNVFLHPIQDTVVRHSCKKGAIIFFAIFLSSILISIYIMTFLREKMNLKAK
jgi:hypothetical protein